MLSSIAIQDPSITIIIIIIFIVITISSSCSSGNSSGYVKSTSRTVPVINSGDEDLWFHPSSILHTSKAPSIFILSLHFLINWETTSTDTLLGLTIKRIFTQLMSKLPTPIPTHYYYYDYYYYYYRLSTLRMSNLKERNSNLR